MTLDPATLAAAFAPHTLLAERLLPHATGGATAAHDTSHVLRVWNNVHAIRVEEGGDALILTAGTLLHDCVAIPKDSPLRSQASRLSAEKASRILAAVGWTDDAIDATKHAIEAHSFSANIQPKSLEAKILQDADRLDAIGMIGVARCFHIGGELGKLLYDPGDPAAVRRPADDTVYTLDHFRTKLLKLADGFQTTAGARLARLRHERLQRFFDEFVEEVSRITR
jgi:uncharacterized protein